MRQVSEQLFGSLGKNRVKFLGPLRGSDVASSLYASDLFVWPAINEVYCMAILKAQAAGLPVIAGNYGGAICSRQKNWFFNQRGQYKRLRRCRWVISHRFHSAFGDGGGSQKGTNHLNKPRKHLIPS
jgi:glycosyltransferase involved in cell wall biosynthesis